MTSLINQISIDGKTTTFLNYVNPVINGEPVTLFGQMSNLLSTQLGANSGLWAGSGSVWNIRFPAPFETMTTSVIATGGGDIRAGIRCQIDRGVLYYNSSNTNTAARSNIPSNQQSAYSYTFAVINDYSLILAAFSTQARSNLELWYIGWAKNGVFTGGQYPRNLVGLMYRPPTFYASRITMENVNVVNTSNATTLASVQPSISCAIATPGADSTDVIIRDSAAPNNYIGKLWNMMVLPSTAVVGKIYRNTGIDPDTGQIETDQKAFWMCVGSWGTDKIGMRVWTEGIV